MRPEFESEGDLPSVDILAGFVKLWRESGSGILRANHAASSARFDLADGEVVGVSSSEPRFDTAAILVRAGKLDATALDRLVAPEGSDRALAALAAGLLTKREWRWGEKIRAIEVLSDLLMWDDGRYTFDSSARPQAQELRLPIPRLLLELFLRSRDRNLVDHHLGVADAPLVRSENFEREFTGFGLTADAESVVQLIDGRATAAEIAEKAPADEFAVQKLLAALVTLGLVRPEFEIEKPGMRAAEEEMRRREREALISDAFPDARGETDFDAMPESLPPPEVPVSPTPRIEEPEESAFRFRSSSQIELPPPMPEQEEEARADSGEERELRSWEPMPAEPLDRTLEIPAPPEGPPRKRGSPLVWLAVLLVVGIAAFLFLRLKGLDGLSLAVRGVPAPTPTALLPEPTEPVPTPIPSPSLETTPPSPARASTPGPRPAVRLPTAVLPAPTRPPSDGERRKWLDRAERDRRRLQSEPRTAYAVQLELACEVPTLEKAWAYDRPPGSLWLLTAPHGNRTCFKVLWGRYGSLEAARRAKSGIPSFFSTGGNRPAVVAVR